MIIGKIIEMKSLFAWIRIVALAGFFFFPISHLPAGEFLITNAKVHTVSGDVLDPGQVHVREGVVQAVGTDLQDELEVEELLNLDGQHLYPGLIEPATTLGLVEISAVRATRDIREVGVFTPDVQSWISVNPDSELIPVARANGITHFLPVPQGGRVSGQSGLVQTDGWTMEDMTIQHPVCMHLFWPNMSLNLTPAYLKRKPDQPPSLKKQDKERKERLREIEELFQQAQAYLKAKQTEDRAATQSGPTPAWEAMIPLLQGKLPLMIHADDVRQIRSAVEWAAAYPFRIIIAGGRDAWQVAELLAEQDVDVIYDATFNLPRDDADGYDVQFRAPLVLHEAGVRFAFSEGLGGFSASMARNLPYQASMAVAFGLPRQLAIESLTLAPARILGVEGRLGSIEPGKEATFFACSGDILDLRSQVTRLWIAGKESSLESRHTRLFQKYKNRPRVPPPGDEGE